MTKQEEIRAMQDDPEIMDGIKRGMQDYHLGHIFSATLVFGSCKGTGGWFYRRWPLRLAVNLKEAWWRIKIPYQNYKHRNCPHCKEFKQWQLGKR